MDINGEAAGDLFGFSLSISADGSTFVVGAPSSSGHVRVYKYNFTVNSYIQYGLDIVGEFEQDEFGYSVSMSADGTTFVVGARFNNENNDDQYGRSSHVRVYKYNSTVNSYIQFGLDIDGEGTGDEFGSSVSINADGTTFVAGAPRNDGKTKTSSLGHVRVFKYSSFYNTYLQVGPDIHGEYNEMFFGTAVSISANGATLVVGTPDIYRCIFLECDVVADGNVRVYMLNSTINRYAQVGLDIKGGAEQDRFGSSVSISADGSTFIVGAIQEIKCSEVFDSGYVRIYRYNDTVSNTTAAPRPLVCQTPTRAPFTRQPLPPFTRQPSPAPTTAPKCGLFGHGINSVVLANVVSSSVGWISVTKKKVSIRYIQCNQYEEIKNYLAYINIEIA
jgi:FG-GAP repeat